MATKATTKKEEKEVKAVKKPAAKKSSKGGSASGGKAAMEAEAPLTVTGKYVYAVGRRKTAIAQVRLYPTTDVEGVIVNKRPIREYFGTAALETIALSPLKLTGMEAAFTVTVVVRGGGLHGQADAIKLGVARCLIKHDILLRPVLKAQGYLTRDARAVERKKPGLKKARRAPQWAKR